MDNRLSLYLCGIPGIKTNATKAGIEKTVRQVTKSIHTKKTGRSKTFVLLLPVFSLSSIEKCLPQGLLAVVLVRNCQFFTSLGTACGEHATAVLRCHSLTETMLVHAAAVVRLKCSFHCSLSLLFCCYISLVQAQCCSLRVQKYT